MIKKISILTLIILLGFPLQLIKGVEAQGNDVEVLYEGKTFPNEINAFAEDKVSIKLNDDTLTTMMNIEDIHPFQNSKLEVVILNEEDGEKIEKLFYNFGTQEELQEQDILLEFDDITIDYSKSNIINEKVLNTKRLSAIEINGVAFDAEFIERDGDIFTVEIDSEATVTYELEFEIQKQKLFTWQEAFLAVCVVIGLVYMFKFKKV